MFNEQETIVSVIEKVESLVLPDFVEALDLVVVDDCSTDKSHELVLEYINGKNIALVRHEVNKGKGAAVHTGMAHAKGDVYFVQDADLELNPDDIPSLLIAMKELNVQFINGSRYLGGVNRVLSSYKRYLGNKFFTFLTSIILDVQLTDMACGYKLIHKDLVNQLNLVENRFGFEAELIIKALRIKRNNIAEVPIQYLPRNEGEGKKLNNTDAIKIFFVILKYGLFKAK